MKLIRLKITDPKGFRSLPEGFELHFLRDFEYQQAADFNPRLLAGSNGSGKSNVLEALAEIFFHLDCMYLRVKPQNFDKTEEYPEGFDASVSRLDAYELEYFIVPDRKHFPNLKNKRVHVLISKELGRVPYVTLLGNDADSEATRDMARLHGKELLPEYVVGYASGNNETLSLPFFKSRFLQYDAYAAELASQEFTTPSPKNSLVYLDESFSQAILLTNLLMWDVEDDDEKKKVLEPFGEYVGLMDVRSFRLVVRLDMRIDLEDEEYPANPDDFARSPTYGLLQNLDLNTPEGSKFERSYLEKLKSCATAWYEHDAFDSEIVHDIDPITGEAYEGRRHLVLDFWVNEATKKAFQFHFEYKPLLLFEVLQLMLVLDLHYATPEGKQRIYTSQNPFLTEDIGTRAEDHNRILRFKDLYVQKKGIESPIYTKALSDGEHQFLHSLGLCLLFKDTRSLFLLDEPETHFNPDWKAKFVTSLRNCFKLEEADSSDSLREMLITTHSPYLISDSQSNYVHVFEKNRETGKVVSAKRPEFQTFGTSVNKIGIRIFHMPHTIGEYAQQRYVEYEKDLQKTNTALELEQLIVRLKTEMGESVEQVLFVNKVLDKIESLG